MANSSSVSKMSKCKKCRRYLPALVAWFLLLSITSLFYAFPALWFYREYSIWILVGEGVLTVIVIAMFSLATFMDPGIIPKAPPGEDNNDDLTAPLYVTADVQGISVRMKWCITCQFYRPPRCSHCSICDHCIETFDHHCPWVNNCIGRRNYRYFFGFLMSLSLHMMLVFSLCLIYLLHHKDRISHLSDYSIFITIFIMVLDAILWFPVFGLAVFHVVLVSRGRTTNEQVTGKYAGGFNPYSKGCLSNCYFTLCFQPYPLLLKSSKKKALSQDMTVVYQASASHPEGPKGKAYHPTTTISAGGNQMKPLRDNGGGGDHHDVELGLQSSQSLDCEGPQSETSFFMMPKNHFPHGSPHPNRQTKESHVEQGPSTMQQRIRAIGGVPTPFTTVTPTSPKHTSYSTPTQGLSRSFGQSQHDGYNGKHDGYNPKHDGYNPKHDGYNTSDVHDSTTLYPESQLYGHQQPGVLKDSAVRILQLASSPQRGSYQWAEVSPVTGPSPGHGDLASHFHHSHAPHLNTSLRNVNSTTTPEMMVHRSYVGHPGDVGMVPHAAPNLRQNSASQLHQQRPVDFVRALEISEAADNYNGGERLRRYHNRPSGSGSPGDNRDLASVYDMNYEISV